MKSKLWPLLFIAFIVKSYPAAYGQNFSEDFEGYADQQAFEAAWYPVYNTNCILVNTNRAVSPVKSLHQVQSSSVMMGSMRTNMPTTTTNLKFSFWFYDGSISQGRNWGAVTANAGSLDQQLVIGKYTSPATDKYFGRIKVGGTNWFLLNGAVDRSVGWHFMEIIGKVDGTVDWKVDGVLGANKPVAPFNFNLVEIGSGSVPSTEAWYDDVSMGPILPVIITSPTNQTVEVGQSASFTVVASGPGAHEMSYQWFQNGSPIPGATLNTFRIEEASSTNAGQYRVVCDNGTGTTTSPSATLTLLETIFGQVQLEGFVGASRTVEFVATNDATGASQTWRLDLAFAGGLANYALSDVPEGATRLSAKTDWNLRRIRPVTLDGNGQRTVNFTGTSELKGGDLVTGSVLSENLVNLSDYLILKGNWYTYQTVADMTGDGGVDLDDYYLLYLNWFMRGDDW